MESEWNEQRLFAIMFFTLSFQARNSQMNGDTLKWKDVLESKMSMSMGILDDKGQKQLLDYKMELDKLYYKFSTTPQRDNVNRSKILGYLKKRLFEIEAKVDAIINKNMPFLKRKKKLDLEGL